MMKMLPMRSLLFLMLFLPVLQVAAHTDPVIEAVTRDGRTVKLLVDHTWEFVEYEGGDPATSAVLSVIKVVEMQDACRLELHMQNNLPFKIRSIVPRFSIYNQDDVLYDSKSKSFTAIKPTKDQYAKVQFNGIGCFEISRVLVHDAARCTMGTIDMFNEEDGQCLDSIYVTPTDAINISK